MTLMGVSAVHDGTAKIFYDESLAERRSLDGVRDKYRSNAIVVLALGTGVTTLAGFANSARSLWWWLTIGAYAASVLAVMYIYWPHAWKRNSAADLALPANANLTDAQTYVVMAEGHQAAFGLNHACITRLATAYRIAMGGAALVVLFAMFAMSVPSSEKPPQEVNVHMKGS